MIIKMRRLLIGLLTVWVIGSLAPSAGPALAQTEGGSLDERADALFAQMSPEQRVGQLFLVSYYGADTGPNSDITTLISKYHVGGVVLSISNENFTDIDPAVDVAQQIASISKNLQTTASGSVSGEVTSTPAPATDTGPYIPLFIGVQNDGISSSTGTLRSGLSPVASSMAVGATWDPDYAEKSGQVVGEELSGLGVNLLLGTSADVVEIPQPNTQGDLGVAVFGGQPFWVSQMVSAYVRGVHEGSNQRLAVVVGHFPGHGGADRLATVEVPIVRKSLDQLNQFDLIPFYAVTGNAPDSLSVADGVLTGHISYRGFQGDNPRVATRPISLDPQALQVLLKLDPIARWRTSGGIVVSDSLGMRGVKRFYDPQETAFNNRRIAQDALLAGNDVLYADQFGSNPPENQAATIEDTIEFFVQQYDADPAFQTRVNNAVHRIIRKKLELYDSFDLDTSVVPQPRAQGMTGQHADIAISVAQNAVTLLYPDKPDLLTAPQTGDRIVIFTDTRPAKLCATCTARPTIAVDALQSSILKSYGPQASAQVKLESVQSFSFDQLWNYLQNGPPPKNGEATPEPDSLEIALNNASWIVFVMQNADASVPSSNAVKEFLAAPSIAPHAQIVVMAMKAPYYLDSTEIYKLAAYYGVYSASSPFIDVAARALFLGVPPSGASPVSVSGINYNIADATSPDPDQVIKLSYESASAQDATVTPDMPVFEQGDVMRLLTGVIVDHNGRPVPDGTSVEFVQSFLTEGLRTSTSVNTVGGVATTSIGLTRPGEIAVTVQSENAHQSLKLTVIIPNSGSVKVNVSSPDIQPTETEGANLTPSPPAGPTPTPTPTPDPHPFGKVNFGDWFVSLLGLAGICATTFLYGYRSRDMNQGLLLALPTLVFGLSGYNYYALHFPGWKQLYGLLGDLWSAGFATWLTGLVGLALTVVLLGGRIPWPRRLMRRRKRRE